MQAQVSLYLFIISVYIVSRINSERSNNIHMLGWKFVPQFDNNKNAPGKDNVS